MYLFDILQDLSFKLPLERLLLPQPWISNKENPFLHLGMESICAPGMAFHLARAIYRSSLVPTNAKSVMLPVG
jgi:hypothetical protein